MKSFKGFSAGLACVFGIAIAVAFILSLHIRTFEPNPEQMSYVMDARSDRPQCFIFYRPHLFQAEFKKIDCAAVARFDAVWK